MLLSSGQFRFGHFESLCHLVIRTNSSFKNVGKVPLPFFVVVIIVTSIANLSLQNDKRELLITLLSSAIGNALHRPSLETSKT
jgi:FtsH-binding integral membrane protein